MENIFENPSWNEARGGIRIQEAFILSIFYQNSTNITIIAIHNVFMSIGMNNIFQKAKIYHIFHLKHKISKSCFCKYITYELY